MLVANAARQSNCGKPLKLQLPNIFLKRICGQVNRLVAFMAGNNVEDWAIRIQAPKSVMLGYGEGSETRWLAVIYEGLADLIWLKV